jgi:glycosyltransferase involved in cell wall biosynthesis
MAIWADEDFEALNGYTPDRVICLKFPTYYLRHSHKVTWLIHQHRPVYDLWEAEHWGHPEPDADDRKLRAEIMAADRSSLMDCRHIYTIAHTVSDRLAKFNEIDSTPLYHPPRLADELYRASSEPFILCPSRLEELKRQSLLIEAMARVRSNVVALIAGDGGQRDELQARIDRLRLRDRVRLLGRVSDEELRAYYAHCRAVFFAPYDEDYGLVALEAMLASKPVITCRDSGEPTRFIVHGVNGFVVEPDLEVVAGAIDALGGDPAAADEMGRQSRESYHAMNISWDGVVDALLA